MLRYRAFRLRRHLESTTALVFTSTLLSMSPALAGDLPSGASIAAGSASIGSTSTSMAITQGSQNAIVNWNSFSIGKDHIVEFLQPSASSAILNRVTGSTKSTIAGSLKANGQVYLINPNGIAITASGSVSVGGGFVASSLDTSDQDFLSGKRKFKGNGASADVTNAGTIRIGRGGYGALIGGAVANDGLIEVETGKIGLGSGEEATLDLSGDGFLQVAAPTNRTDDKTLMENRGKISATGGQVVMSAATARNAARHAINLPGSVEATTIGGTQGRIVIGGGDGGKVTVSGKVKATASRGKGGKITITGQSIALNKAQVDASGSAGGGTILIGGARQGRGATQTAETTEVDTGSTIKADATINGNGGDVVIWSDLITGFDGAISARGAGQGSGGEAEVSGKARLDYEGSVDLTSDSGRFGNLLLDPYNVTIANAPAQNSSGLTATGNDSVIGTATLTDALSKANVTITTGAAGSAGTQAGDITVVDPVTWNSRSSLTLSAYRNVSVDANLTGGNGSSIALRADNSGTGAGTVSFAGGVKATAPGGVNLFYNPSGNDASTVNAASFTTPMDYSAFIGSNTSLTSYMLVNTVYDLQNIQNNLSGNYALGRNVDATTSSSWNGGVGFDPIGDNSHFFSGKLNGLGHVIDGLSIDRVSPEVQDSAGLFYVLNAGSVVRNLGITNATVNAAYDSGILASAAFNATIEGVFTTGGVSGHGSVGGLFAYSSQSNISKSYSTANVLGFDGGSISGGLIGDSEEDNISDSYATGNVSAAWIAGGLIGMIYDDTLMRTYAAGSVVSGSIAGGLVGTKYDTSNSSRIFDSVWDKEATGQSHSFGSSDYDGLTTAQMRDPNFIWQFQSSSWARPDANHYAELYGVSGVIGVSQSGTYGQTPNTTYYDGGFGSYTIQSTGGLTSSSAAGSYASIGLSSFRGVTAAGTPIRFVDNGAYIDRRKITVTADDKSKVYGSANPAFSYTINGGSLINGDLLSGSLATAATNASGVGSYGITLGSLGNSNYDISYIGGTLSVTPKTMTITANNMSRAYGNTNPTFNYTATGLVNGDSLTGSLTTAATTSSGVGSYAITQGSLANSNYNISYVGGVLSVTPRTLTVTGNNLSRIYGDANPALTYTANGLVNGDSLTGGLTTAATSSSNVGSYAVGQGTLSASANYNLNYVGGILTVTPRMLTVAANNLSRVYGDSNPTFTYTASGLVNGDSLTGSLATAATGASNVGSYAISQGTLGASANYNLNYVGGILTVTPRALTVATNNLSRVYGDSNPTFTYTANGLVNGDSLSGNLTTAATGSSNVGSYAITQGSLANSNYNISYLGGLLTVTPRTLTVTGNNVSRIYGNANPTLGYTASGLVNGDSLTGSLTTAATGSSDVGTYVITQGSLANSNYNISYLGGLLTVTPRTLTVTGNNVSRIYGNANPTLGYTASGLVNGDSLTGSLTTAATGSSDVGTYVITQGSLANSNYNISYLGGLLTITPRTLTVTASNLSRVYGDANPAFTYIANGLVNGDSLSGKLATAATSTSNVGSYAIGQGTLGASANYKVNYLGGILTVTRRPVTITAANSSKVYGDDTPNLAYTVGGSGLVNGDTPTGALSSSATKTSHIGSYEIGAGSLSLSSNYSLSFQPGKLTIVPRALAVKADDATRAPGAANPAFSYKITSGNLVNGDQLLGSPQSAANASSPAGVYDIGQGTLRSPSDYSFSFTPGKLAVVGDTKATPTPPPATSEPSPTAIITQFITTQQSQVVTTETNDPGEETDPFHVAKNNSDKKTSTTSTPAPSNPASDPTSTLEQELGQ
ncbi:MBG domain-containing protein [Oryzifoliimicrobium ureilyticus]|uniref:MBG domain-containing protein n=1 Tax=Oryzifoliimicrobium ureilyticus TaxID=3113724 RepID=UPI0030763D7B